MISATEMLGGSWHAPRENFEMIDAFWCIILTKNGPLFFIKNIDCSY